MISSSDLSINVIEIVLNFNKNIIKVLKSLKFDFGTDQNK